MSYPMMVSSQAEGDVLRERERQHYEERWTAEHDDQHAYGEMARAAACYAQHAGYNDKVRREALKYGRVPGNWPWDRRWWKPKDRRRDLVRAAALIIAEIERLDRAADRGRPVPHHGSGP